MKRAILRWHHAIAIGAQLALVAIANLLAFWLRFDGAVPEWARTSMWSALPALVAIRGLTFIPFRLYEGLWRYTSLYDLRAILLGVGTSTVLFAAGVQVAGPPQGYPRSIFVIDALILVCALSALRLSRRLYEDLKRTANAKRVLIIGAGSAGELVARDMLQNRHYGLKPIGFLDDSPDKKGRRIHGVPVVGSSSDLAEVVRRLTPDEVVVAMPSASPAVIRALLRALEPFHLGIRTLPSLRDLLRGQVSAGQLRAFRMEDVLQRVPARLEGDGPRRLIEGRRVLVTGAGSGVGAELCRQILALGPARVTLVDRYEQALRATTEELAHAGADVAAAAVDITDAKRLQAVFALHEPHVVFHTDAHNQARQVREDACEAVRHNVRGISRLVDACTAHGVERLVVVSSTAAASPTTPHAATRQLAERIVRRRAAGGALAASIVRLGSILGHPGSLVPELREQIRSGGPVKVSHPEVRRYFMLISEAVTLTLYAAAESEAGSVTVLDMGEPLRVVELARNLIRLEGLVPDTEIPIQFTGLGAGERLLDVLAAPDEIVAPTSTKGVLRVKPRVADEAGLLEKAEALASAAERGDHEAVHAMLAALVPSTGEPAARHQPDDLVFRTAPPATAPVSPDDEDTGQACPSCGRRTAQRSRARSAPERLRKSLSSERLFRCSTCGWRGWMTVMDTSSGAGSAAAGDDVELGELDVALTGADAQDVPLDKLD